jgi:hypothetical protein
MFGQLATMSFPFSYVEKRICPKGDSETQSHHRYSILPLKAIRRVLKALRARDLLQNQSLTQPGTFVE